MKIKIAAIVCAAMMSLTGFSQTVIETVSSGLIGDATLKIEADTDNNNEGDNSWLEIMQDGGLTGAFIGFNQDWGNDNLFRIVPRYAGVNTYDRFIINGANGNVGIGTTSPQANFNVQSFSNTIGWNDLTKASLLIGNAGSGIGMDSNEIASKGGHLYIGTIDTDDDVIFRAGGASSRLQINGATGNIGIGTTTPNAKLDVENGDIYIGEEAASNGIRRQIRVYGYDSNSKYYGSIHSNYDDNKRTFDISTNDKVHQIKIDASANTSGNVLIQPGINGKVGIGTTTPDSKLTVAGNVHAQEVKVTINAGADFVFEDNYQLPKLQELQTFIKTNKHLPEIASAKEMETDGLELGEMNIKLLQKIEELTLYTIDQGEQLENQRKEIELLKKENARITKLEETVEKLINNME